MSALSNNTFQRGMFAGTESMIDDRLQTLARSAATACGALLVAYLLFVVSTVQGEGAQSNLGSFASVGSGFDNQFDPLEVDLYARPGSRNLALVAIPFDPLLP